jgi:lipoprotein-releasing system permease protein
LSYSPWLALRYLAKARQGGFLGRVSLLALLGVAIGVATLLTVFAFVQGFQDEVRALLTNMNPAIFLSSLEPGGIANAADLGDEVTAVAGVRAASPFIQQKGVLSLPAGRDLRLRGAVLRGIDAAGENAVTGLLGRCDPPFAGFALPGQPPGILLGKHLAEELGALPGERLTFTTAESGESLVASHHVFFVLGVVESGLYEFDRRFAYIDIDVARVKFREGRGVDGLGLGIDDPMGAEGIAETLAQRYGFPEYQVASWMDLNGEVFQWMKTMRAILFLALSLIILVAGFNIAGSMTIIVTEKTREIGLLLSLGASRLSVLAVFLIEGWLIGLAGVVGGGLLGLALLAWFTSHPLNLPGEVYFIDHMPARLSPELFLAIAGSAVLVAFFALVLPGLEALRRTPLDALQQGGDLRG